MKALDDIVKALSKMVDSDDQDRIDWVRVKLDRLSDNQRIALEHVAQEQAEELGEKKKPTAVDARRLQSLVDVTSALAEIESSSASEAGAADTNDDDEQDSNEDGGETVEGTIVPDSPAAIDVPGDSQASQERRPDMASAMSMQKAQKFAGASLAGMPKHALSTSGNAGTMEVFAAADMPGKPMGTKFADAGELGRIVGERMRTLSSSGQGKYTAGLAVYKRMPDEERSPKITHDMPIDQIRSTLSRVTNPGRLQKNANGTFQNVGWCAPSEIDWTNFCDIPPLSGLIDLPSITINRGGIRLPIEPGLEELWGAAFTECYTEAEIMDREDPKVCYSLPCLEFDEHRLNMCHVCVTNSILQNYAYPEMISHYIDLLMFVFEHIMNGRIIQQMVDIALEQNEGAPYVPGPGTGGPLTSATTSVLESADIMAEHIRYRRRLQSDAVIEMVAPLWLRGVMRGDLAKRPGVDLLDVTDADLERYLAARNIRAQWVYDWQDAFTDENMAGFGGAEQFLTDMRWPNSVRLLMFPAGSFYLARDEFLRITGQYDYELLQYNNQLGIFAETAWQVIPRCYGAVVADIPICSNGATGELGAVECPVDEALAVAGRG